MITNDLLREKYRVQKALDEKAQHSLTQYVANAHANVKKAEIKYGVKFKYSQPPLFRPKSPNQAPDAELSPSLGSSAP